MRTESQVPMPARFRNLRVRADRPSCAARMIAYSSRSCPSAARGCFRSCFQPPRTAQMKMAAQAYSMRFETSKMTRKTISIPGSGPGPGPWIASSRYSNNPITSRLYYITKRRKRQFRFFALLFSKIDVGRAPERPPRGKKEKEVMKKK